MESRFNEAVEGSIKFNANNVDGVTAHLAMWVKRNEDAPSETAQWEIKFWTAVLEGIKG